LRVLLVEDDAMLGAAVCEGLRQDGYVVDWVMAAAAARSALATTSFAALVLDLGLRQIDGTTVLRWVRAQGDPLPILITTARDQIAQRVAALDAGADDYLVKPFDLDELAARLRALMRRADGRTVSKIELGEVTIDCLRRTVALNGRPVALTGREYALFAYLARKSGRVVTRSEIEEQLYGFDDAIASNAIEVHIHHLRRKLGPHVITNQKGRGYCVGTGG
jgi:two-component system, OmpR family, response regulator QseB